MLLGAFVSFRTCVIAALAFVFIIVFSKSASAINDSQVKCSRTCKPCDDLDACCKIHDECVDKKGCIKKVQKSGNVGFSWKCPYDTVVPTMVQGMDMAILLSQLGDSKFEL
ncbi:putative phospholipase A2 [Citrus sinensis]|nr:putative phospholipase A2 [Citrus sinensis]